MPTKTISKSTKPRQGVYRYKQNGGIEKQFDREPRQWKQQVITLEHGKKVNGQVAYKSFTQHIPA